VLRWLEPFASGRTDGAVHVSRAGSVSQADLYLDTDDRRFHRAGYSLRIRRKGRRVGGEATLKALETDRPGTGPLVRREVTEPLDRSDAAALLNAPGPVGERVRALVGSRRLLPLFEVRTRRQTFDLHTEDSTAAGELALDETTIRSQAGRTLARLRRVEVETPGPPPAAVAAFVERLREASGLHEATLSKYEAGYVATGPHRPTVPSYGSTAIGPDLSIEAAAFATLRRHFTALVTKEPGTRLGDDIEELHDMRVATRRLRAALALFRDVLPPQAEELREELRWLAAVLGAVRDLDVQLEQLEEWIAALPAADRDALEKLRALLLEERREARTAMLEALDSRRYQALVRRFGSMVRAARRPRSALARQPATAVAPDLVEASFRRVRKAARRIGPDSQPADYHRVRIACKRLRYTLEFLADVYPGETKRLVKRLVALQDILGLNQDADVAIARLRDLARERGGDLGPEPVFAMGEIAERYRREMRELQARFPAAYARLDGKEWKAFRRLIEAARPAAPAPVDEAPNPA
jgi:CHAD domain-containing protein